MQVQPQAEWPRSRIHLFELFEGAERSDNVKVWTITGLLGTKARIGERRKIATHFSRLLPDGWANNSLASASSSVSPAIHSADILPRWAVNYCLARSKQSFATTYSPRR
jgi:hypothetical protein